MTTTVIILIAIIYILMAIISYRPLKHIAKIGDLTNPGFASMFWIGIWILLTIGYIIEIYQIKFKKEK